MEQQENVQPTFEEIQIPVPFGYVSAKWWGPRDKQPIIAIHGWQDNAGTFDPLIELLPKELSILCIDLPGHGRSSHIPPGIPYYLFWDGLTILRRIVRHYNWRNISIMGHSLGAAIGFLYAASYPDDTEMLISIDTVAPVVFNPAEIVKNTGPFLDRFFYYESLGTDKMPAYGYSDMIDLVMDGHHSTLTRKACETLMKRGMYPVKDNKYFFSRDTRLKVNRLALPTYETVLEFAKQIHCRYLMIKAVPGRVRDNWVLYKNVLDTIKESTNDFTYVEVEGSHHVHLNDAPLVAPYILNFLYKSDPSVK
ncbi:probable serine hydrolase isoform X1 [Adelges cooleyi]|uniref:probable serine hydrolase isoform X1 n=1 Tax=Adelges cooleyi TaxID=133065 RepID=UPI00218062BA|nr:probable serine hydrolase isoform X1 [Adelges cooleyi]XP_050428892.1 probable serine hydrolase isoform X1 [Adelges cooleyi]XP_050428893.1 probable serine hydrolase isoform X1 [Adelges cooleyi]XP_050428894.1 probable serine hydrolase isoform X1 [Adelges cooleyi]XP_050428895.1 probable serine hydrolase isoform X1 [Adelges cooleyi]